MVASQNTARKPNCWLTAPPASGPSAIPPDWRPKNRLNTRPRTLGRIRSTALTSRPSCQMAMPAPYRNWATSTSWKLEVTATMAAPAAAAVGPMSIAGLRPMRSISTPEGIVMTARPNDWAVTTWAASAGATPNAAAMAGMVGMTSPCPKLMNAVGTYRVARTRLPPRPEAARGVAVDASTVPA